MARNRRVSIAWSLPFALLLAAASPLRSAECTLTPEHWAPPEALWRSLSRSTAAVAAESSTRRGRPARRLDVLPVRNVVDQEISATLRAAGVSPTRLTTDEEFLRRVSLDLTGALPSRSEVEAFVADQSPDKRTRKIDELLGSEGYVDRWTLWFGDLVQNVRFSTNINLYPEGRNAYHAWIRESFAENKPYDQMVRELMAATGDNWQSGAANYTVRQLQPNGPPQDTYDNLAASSVQKFWAMPFECLSCHSGAGHLELVNGYLSTRERDDFWGMAAFFARTGARPQRDGATNRFRFNVTDRAIGGYELNTTTGNKSPRQPSPGAPNVVAPEFLTASYTPVAFETHRAAFGRLLTSDRQFARATVNYVWKELFHLGIVEPSESFDLLRLDPESLPPGAELQPTHPALLERLTDFFIESGYDWKALIRLLADSNAYQLSIEYTAGEWNEAWTPLFARHYAHRLHAEVLLDAICTATSVPVTFPIEGLGGIDRAIRLPDPTEGGRRNPHALFLDAFGRGDRDATPRTSAVSILQALHLLNDVVVTQRVRAVTRNSTVQQVLRETNDPAEIARRLYLSTLSRQPSPDELASAIGMLQSPDRTAAAEDLQYSLINRLEFLFN